MNFPFSCNSADNAAYEVPVSKEVAKDVANALDVTYESVDSDHLAPLEVAIFTPSF